MQYREKIDESIEHLYEVFPEFSKDALAAVQEWVGRNIKSVKELYADEIEHMFCPPLHNIYQPPIWNPAWFPYFLPRLLELGTLKFLGEKEAENADLITTYLMSLDKLGTGVTEVQRQETADFFEQCFFALLGRDIEVFNPYRYAPRGHNWLTETGLHITNWTRLLEVWDRMETNVAILEIAEWFERGGEISKFGAINLEGAGFSPQGLQIAKWMLRPVVAEKFQRARHRLSQPWAQKILDIAIEFHGYCIGTL